MLTTSRCLPPFYPSRTSSSLWPRWQALETLCLHSHAAAARVRRITAGPPPALPPMHHPAINQVAVYTRQQDKLRCQKRSLDASFLLRGREDGNKVQGRSRSGTAAAGGCRSRRLGQRPANRGEAQSSPAAGCGRLASLSARRSLQTSILAELVQHRPLPLGAHALLLGALWGRARRGGGHGWGECKSPQSGAQAH